MIGALQLEQNASWIRDYSTLGVLGEESLSVLINNVVNHFVGHAGKPRALDDIIDLTLARDDLSERGGGKIGTEDQFMLDTVLDGRHERLVMS